MDETRPVFIEPEEGSVEEFQLEQFLIYGDFALNNLYLDNGG